MEAQRILSDKFCAFCGVSLLVFAVSFPCVTRDEKSLKFQAQQLVHAPIAQIKREAEADPKWLQSQFDAIKFAEYEPSLKSGVWHFANRANNLRSYISSEAWAIEPRVVEKDSAKWSWNFKLQSVSGQQIKKKGTLSESSKKVEIRRSSNISEWYLNSPQGIEQGFTILRRPEPAPKVIEIKALVETDLKVSAHSEKRITFSDGKLDLLNFGAPSAQDKNGQALGCKLALTDKGMGSFELALLVDTSGATFPVYVDPLASAPGVTIEADQDNAELGFQVASAGDTNADGFSDILIGVPGYDNGFAGEGRALLYLGSSSGLHTTPDWFDDGGQTGAALGAAVSTAGDLNADGYSDFAVSAPGLDTSLIDAGEVQIFFGGPNPPPAVVLDGDQAGARFGASISTAGDINADGFSDLLIGAPFHTNTLSQEGRAFLYYGSAEGISALPAWSFDGGQLNAYLGSALSFAGDLNGDGFSDLVLGAYGSGSSGEALVFMGSASGLASAPNWRKAGAQSGAAFGKAVSAAGDVNGDGYADLIISAPEFNNSFNAAGRVELYLGSASGLSDTPAWTAEGDRELAHFGSALCFAGDVNGDGYADIAVGADHYSNGNLEEGAVFLFVGSQNGLENAPSWSFESDQAGAHLGAALATAGDINGDGFSDLLVGAPNFSNGNADEGRAYIFYGSAAAPALAPLWHTESGQAGAALGTSLASAGDVNGDGFSDVIVGAPNYDNGLHGQGRVYIYFGSANGLSNNPDWVVDGDQEDCSFGFSVAGAGDVNGDGFSDVIIGARFYDNGEINEGRAYLYLGSASGPSTTAAWSGEPNQEYSFFGYSVAGAGDVNGDGYSDVIVGAYRYDITHLDEGAAFVYYGSASGLSATPNWVVGSGQDLADFGISVASAGDVNGDGYSDVIVGARFYDLNKSNEGAAFVYLGSANGLSTTPAWINAANQVAAGYGGSVSSAGDVNGDGYSDVIVGSRFYDNGEVNEGRAFVYLGSATGLSHSAAWVSEGNQAYADYGFSVASAGDVNGDGFSDVLVGADSFDGSFTDEGKAYLYLGSSSGLASTPAWSQTGGQATAAFGSAVASAGDINGDGFSDLLVAAPNFQGSQSAEGRASLYLGNGTGGVSIKPKQSDFALNLMQPLGVTRQDSFTLQLHARSAMGRTRARLVWENKRLGLRLNGSANQLGTAWSDIGLNGADLDQAIAGLSHKTNYHWHARIQYLPLMNYSPWFSVGNNGVNESDLRVILPPTPTPTFTPNLTATDIPTPDATATASAELTATAEATLTPPIDATATAIAELTATAEATLTPPIDATATAIAELTASAAPTDSPTPDATSTAIANLTASAAPTATASAQLTATAAATMTIAAEATQTAAARTPTATPTITPSLTPSASPTATARATRTPTATATPTCPRLPRGKPQRRVEEGATKFKANYDLYWTKILSCGAIQSSQDYSSQVTAAYLEPIQFLEDNFSPVDPRCKLRRCDKVDSKSIKTKLKRYFVKLQKLVKRSQKLAAKQCQAKPKFKSAQKDLNKIIKSIDRLPKKRYRCRD